MLSDGADGAPAWLAWIDTRAASALNQHGLAASIVLAVLLAAVAVAVFLPARAVRAAVVLAVVLAAALWLAQGMGELFTGMSTDPASGPLLALLALAFWPAVTGKEA
jgi:fucose permease